jgi:hypothetical protein
VIVCVHPYNGWVFVVNPTSNVGPKKFNNTQ